MVAKSPYQAHKKLDNAQKNLDRVKEDENKKKAALAKIRAEGEALGKALNINMNREANTITQEIDDLIKKKTEEAEDSEQLPWKNKEEFKEAMLEHQGKIVELEKLKWQNLGSTQTVVLSTLQNAHIDDGGSSITREGNLKDLLMNTSGKKTNISLIHKIKEELGKGKKKLTPKQKKVLRKQNLKN